MMVNGNKVNIFTQSILPLLQDKIRNHCQNLNRVNKQLETALLDCNTNNETHTDVHRVSSQHAITSIQAEPEGEANDTYICPVCETDAELNTIACEECNAWYHYNCVGLSPTEVKKIHEEVPFVCESCNDNLLCGNSAEIRRSNSSVIVTESHNNSTQPAGVNPKIPNIMSPETNRHAYNDSTKLKVPIYKLNVKL